MVNLAKWHQLRQHLFRECYDHSAVNVWLVGWLACEVWWHVLMSLYLVNVRGVLCRQCVAFGWLVGLWSVVVTCCDIASRPQLRPKPSKRHLWTHLCANLFVRENINHFWSETNFFRLSLRSRPHLLKEERYQQKRRQHYQRTGTLLLGKASLRCWKSGR